LLPANLKQADFLSLLLTAILILVLAVHGPPAQDAIFRVLLLGGDTDTNACIVGYMMGALKGLEGIPEVSALVCASARDQQPQPFRVG